MDNKPENRFDGKMDTPKKAFMYASKPPKLWWYGEKLVELQPNLRLKYKIYDFVENIKKRKMA